MESLLGLKCFGLTIFFISVERVFVIDVQLNQGGYVR